MKKWAVFNCVAGAIICLCTWTSIVNYVLIEYYQASTFISFLILISSLVSLIKTKDKWNILGIILVTPSFLVFLFFTYLIVFQVPLAP